MFSQFGADRYVADPINHAVKLGLAVFATPAVEGDYIEVTELTARMDGTTIGTDYLEWRLPNSGAVYHGNLNVFEWIQEVHAPITRSGLVEISVVVKLNSQTEKVVVDGKAYIHISIKDTNDELVPPDEYLDALELDDRVWSW